MPETVTDTLDKIPPEAWPLIDLLFNLTMAAAGVWMAITVFVVWRRRSSNLTPVNLPSKNRKSQPDFLKVDHKAREAAIKRGEGFEKELERRERDEARRAARHRRSPATIGQRIAGIVTLIMSLFTLASMIYGSIFTVTRMGGMMEEYSTQERIIAVIQAHPIAFVITILVIFARIFTFFMNRNELEG